ncbi:MAG: DMT family transporter [Rhodospirillaceae bacterium]|nr:DMT family transporter [Rhodospirillaceae bacterium]MBT7268842.1 DMT family transporter [Rhodospirillaceae bacterium]
MSKKFEIHSANLRGILYMLLGTLFLTAMTAIARHLSDQLHPFEIAFFRCLMGLFMLLPILFREGIGSMRTENIGGMALRSVFHTGGMLMFFMALTLMPLAELSSLTFTSPLFITILAVFIFGEKLGPRRIASLVIGFFGALIILRPGSGLFGIGAVYALASVISWAGAVIVIKHLSRTNSTVTITIYGLFFLTIFTLLPALFVWRWPTQEEFMWLAVLAVVGTIGQLLFTQAMKSADVSLVMPFDFSKLIWASLFGFFFFAEIPSYWTYLGGGIIFVSATYVAYRERQSI